MNRIRLLWSKLITTFWFVPTLIVAISILIAMVLIEVDSGGSEDWLARWPRIFGSGADGARGMLSTISGSTMTVVGVTFSMTLVALTLASSQYTSRVLRNFMRDRVTQVVLGIFAGIFTYCLIVLRTVRSGDEDAFIPSLAVTFAVVLAIGGILTLIFFIHHISSSIQASSIVASVAAETNAAVDRLFPEKLGEGQRDDAGNPVPTSLAGRNWQKVSAKKNGYIQSLDSTGLLGVAKKYKTIVRMEHGVGEFVIQDTPLVSIALDSPPDDEMIGELQNAFGIDRFRTVVEDASFGIRQLVDIALRSLSPGVNDTTTAIMCVDYLTAILSRLVTKDIPSSHRYEDGELRVIAIGSTFAGLVSISFDQIRGSAGGNDAIMRRMLGALETVGKLTDNRHRREVLAEQVGLIEELGSRSITSKHDLARFNQRVAQVRASLGGEDEPTSSRELR